MPPTIKHQLTPAKDLVEASEERKGKHKRRTEHYKRFLAAYYGDDSERLKLIGNNGDGRPALRMSRDIGENWAKRGSPNYIQPMVDDFTALRGLMPNVQVKAASSKDADKEKAVLLTRALREQIDHSHMDMTQPQAAFYLSCLGDVCYVLDPRTPQDTAEDEDPFRPVGVYITVVNPEHAFPKFRFGADALEMDDLFLVWHLDADTIYDTYGISVASDEGADVIHYYSRWEKQIIVDGKRHVGVVHDLGFCPGQWCSNKATDGTYAQSDIRQAVDLHSELQAIFHVYLDSLLWSTWPIIHIKNRHNVSGDQIEIGPGAQVETINDGDVQLVAPQAQPQAARLIHDSTLDALMKMVGVSPIRMEGQIDRSNVSARSVDRQQGPQEQRLTLGNTILGEAWERINGKILLMLSNVKSLAKTSMELYGQDGDGIYNETFKGEDVGGWIKNEVKWDSMLGSSRHERVAVALQMFKEGRGKYPWRRVLEEAGEDDPQALIEEGMAEMQQEHAMEAQMGGGPPGPGGPPGGGRPHGPGAGHPHGPEPPGSNSQQAMQDAVSMTAGGGGAPAPPGGAAQPPPPAPPGPPIPPFAPVANAPTKPGMGNPAPVPHVMQMIHEALAPLKLFGKADAEPSGSGIHVMLTDHRDVAQVKKALDLVAKQIRGPRATVTTEIQKGN